MQLYLSSFGCGRHVTRLREWLDGTATIAVLSHALDAATSGVLETVHARELPGLRAAGLRPELVDLRTDGMDALRKHRAVWVLGGNVFVLREALAETGADGVILDRLSAGTLVYGGYSAGACVLGPTLRGFDLVDDPGHASRPRWDGLGVLDRPLVPHIASPQHPESLLCESLSDQFTASGTPHWRLSDGDALLVEDGRTTLLATVSEAT